VAADDLRRERGSLRAAADYRRGTIAGYGNSIVPQVAAEFVHAFIEVTP